MVFQFEPEVVLPHDPYDAARVFLGVLAYPELGAGSPGGAGSGFASSLGRYLLWAMRKEKGLTEIRCRVGNPAYQPPQWAQFRGQMNRGLKRIQRRTEAYSLFGDRLLDAFFTVQRAGAQAIAEGRPHEAFHMEDDGQFGVTRSHLWETAFRSAPQTMLKDVDGWAERLGLNLTGRAADSRQKVKDLCRRAVAQSMPVLHMAFAFDEACREAGPGIGDWDRRDPALALLLNAEMWIDRAIQSAEQWRLLSNASILPDVTPDSLIKIDRERVG